MYIYSIFFILVALAVSPLYENENQNVDLDLLFKKALEAGNNSKFNDALFYLDEILKHDPDNVLALNNKGGVLIYLERYEEALPYLEKSIEINPNFVDAINNKAAALYNLNRNVDALATFYEAYKINPYDTVVVENMASIVNETQFVREFGYAKIELRSSDDQLVAYTESHDLGFQYPLAWMFLEDKAEWKQIEIDGKEFELLEYSTSYPVTKPGLSTLTNIALIEKDASGVFIIQINHDGFLTKPGDTMNVKLVLLRNS